MALDKKLRSRIVEGISVIPSLFDLPDVAGVFCPPPPQPFRAPSELPILPLSLFLSTCHRQYPGGSGRCSRRSLPLRWPPSCVSQAVTIRFYQSGIPPLDIRESVLTIPRQSKVSRYLSDLVDLEGLEDTSTPLRKHNAGVVRIQGETEIAVAAVQVSEATQWFQTVLVSPEPKGR